MEGVGWGCEEEKGRERDFRGGLWSTEGGFHASNIGFLTQLRLSFFFDLCALIPSIPPPLNPSPVNC